MIDCDFAFLYLYINIYDIHSMECLLSFVEFSQYRETVFNHCNKRKLLTANDIKSIDNLPFKLPSTVPKSSIIFARPFNQNESNQEFIQKIKRKAFILFNKYICIGSEYEININYRLRREMNNLMGNLSEFLQNENIKVLELITIFDASSLEMINLIADAFRRFTTTTQFLKLSDLIFVKRELELISVETKR